MKRNNIAIIGAAAAVVIAIAVGAYFWSRRSPEPPPPPPPAAVEPPPAVVPPPTPDPPPVTPPVADPAGGAGAGTGAGVPPPAAGTPPAGTTGTVTTPGTAGAAPGRTGGAAITPGGTPTAGTPPATTGTPAPGRVGAPAANDEAATFGSVKLFTVKDRGADETDVTVNFGSGQIAVVPRNGGAPVATLPYRRIVRATYIRADNPRWDPALPSPPEKLDLSGAFNRDRHWLMLQMKDGYTLIRLDGDAWLTVLQTFEARTGIKIDRPAK